MAPMASRRTRLASAIAASSSLSSSILSADSRYSTLQALSSAGRPGPLLPAFSWP
jgi:hypothetical protein